MPTGILSLDLATGGIRPGELWTIGALPGKGKTAIAVQVILANGANRNAKYAFSLEMQDLEIGKRFLAAKSSLPAIQIRKASKVSGGKCEPKLQVKSQIVRSTSMTDLR